MIRFTVKELLAQIIASIDKLKDQQDRLEDRLEGALALKANRAEFEDHERRIIHFEKQETYGQEVLSQFKQAQKDINANARDIDILKANTATKTAIGAYRKWLIGVGVGSAGAMVSVAVFVLSHLKFH